MSLRTIYMDYAAATPIDPIVISAMQPFLSDKFYNASASYLAAKSVAKEIGSIRSNVAQILGAKSPEIIFTAGGTEANNLAVKGVMSRWLGSNIVISAIEHESVIEPAGLYDYRVAPVDDQGIVDITLLKKAINDQTVLVSIIYANNEIGTIQPLKKTSQLIEEIRKERGIKGNPTPLYFHSDACQAAAYLDLHVNQLGLDLMTLNSGKIYGPKQTGILYVRRGLDLNPQVHGGGQESGFRSGTENVANIVGFGHALELAQSKRKQESERLSSLQTSFINLLKEKVPTATVNGSLKKRLPNNVHITIDGIDNEMVMMALDEVGVLCATGSACHASSGKKSSTLDALGLSESQARSSLRFTMGKNTRLEDVVFVVENIAKILS